MREAKVYSVVMSHETGQYLITLEDINGSLLLPIWIGPAEGMAIAAILQNHKFARPLTHDLLFNAIKELKAGVEKVIITDLRDNTFYANIILKTNGAQYTIDARPSDSIALALRAKAPIFIEEKVFNACPKIHKPISEKEIADFKNKIQDLRPEDFFKGPQNE